MVTRKDVADYAGVSPATVSNVINNKDVVRPKMRAKVLQAIKELGYQPNMVARSLKTRRTKQIALIINDITNQFFAEVALGMEDEARKAGCVVCVINASGDQISLEEIITRQFDGIIVLTDKIKITELNGVAQHNIPLVFIGNEGYTGVDQSIIQIHLDIYHGAYQLFTYLVEQGHTGISFISGRKLTKQEPDYRLRAYRDVLHNHNLKFEPALVYTAGGALQEIYNITRQMLTQPQRPTAIFTGNDHQASAVMAAVRSLGLSIPGDICVAGFDNLESSAYSYPPLTTVETPKYSLGQLATRQLLQKIHGQACDDILLPTQLIVRESTR